jgi:hypothetical protein
MLIENASFLALKQLLSLCLRPLHLRLHIVEFVLEDEVSLGLLLALLLLLNQTHKRMVSVRRFRI